MLEHPAEMAAALLLHTGALIVLRPVLDCAAVVVHIFVKAACASLNHSGKEVSLLGGLYSSGPHHLHHALRNVNFGQTCFLFDRLIGTYRAGVAGTAGRGGETPR